MLYWWHILSVSKCEMIRKVYKAQKLILVAGYWILLLEKDKKQFNIQLNDEEISSFSKQTFKNYVKKKAQELAIVYLKKIKQKNSKSQSLDVEDLVTSPYLLNGRFSREERELLFKLRSKTICVKNNFKNAYLNNDMLCKLCKLFTCSQSHPLQCPQLNLKLVVNKTVVLNDSDVYGSIDKQLIYTKIYKQFWELREKLLNEKKEKSN